MHKRETGRKCEIADNNTFTKSNSYLNNKKAPSLRGVVNPVQDCFLGERFIH